jgi:CelD/BcsL family acetyltransferase involved in cellulose biosynthesis
MAVKLSIITSYQEFKTISFAWEQLRRQLNDSAFSNSWSWLNTWLEFFQRSKDQLHIHIWHDEDELVGLIPCYLKSTLAGKELRFIGTGEPQQSEVCSEFQDFLIQSQYKDIILAQFSLSIVENKKISAIIFEQVLTTSMAYQWFESVKLLGKNKVIRHIGSRYLIPLVAGQDQQVSLFRSKNIKRHAKKIVADSDWHVNMVNDEKALAKFFSKLVTQHNHAWQQRGEVGAFENTLFTDFHRAFSQKLLKKKALIAFEISHKNEFAALFYGIVDGDTLYYYQSAVNNNSKLSSAGVAMHLVALEFARENNFAYYDLMKGGSDSYKNQYLTSGLAVVSLESSTKIYRLIIMLIRCYKKIFGERLW